MLGRKGVVRDVEAGGSNPLTPTTKPLVTGLREQPGQGLSSISKILGAIRVPGSGVTDPGRVNPTPGWLVT